MVPAQSQTVRGKTVVALKAVAAVHQRNGLGRTHRD